MDSSLCIFCKIVQKVIPAAIVYDNGDVLAFNDIKPQAPVHVVIIPKAHINNISDISEKDAALVGKMIFAAKMIAKNMNIEKSGYRLVFNCNKDAGQEVFHIHAHLMGGRKFAWPPG